MLVLLTILQIVEDDVWPLSFLLVSLVVLRQLRDDLRPIATGVINGVAAQSSRNALAWAFGLMIATLGSLNALVEVAEKMHWIYLAAFAKVLQPGLAAVIGYVTKSPGQQKDQTTPPTSTTPPFPASPSTPAPAPTTNPQP